MQTFSEARRPFGLLLFQTLLDLIFPAACSGCERVDAAWCWHCQQNLENAPIMPVTRHSDGIGAIASTALHDGILQKAIHGLKYDNLPQLAQPLGVRLAQTLTIFEWSPDVIIPIPNHINRLKSRGYNQAQLIAETVANLTQLPCLPHAAQRIRDTQSQVGLNSRERKLNVADAFWADQKVVEGKTVLLIDDVLTTGATLNGCGQALLHAGAKQVYCLTVTTASL